MDASKKEWILAAAARLFGRYGFKRVSVEEISREAGVAKGTLYLACESKEDLFVQVFGREVNQFAASFEEWIDSDTSIAQQFGIVSKKIFDYLGEHSLLMDLLLGRQAEVLPGRTSELHGLRAGVAWPMSQFLRLGIEQGVVRKNVDVETMAMLFIEMHVSTWLSHALGPEAGREQRRKARWQAGVELALQGIFQPTPK